MKSIESGIRFTPPQIVQAVEAALPGSPPFASQTPDSQFSDSTLPEFPDTASFENISQPMFWLPGPKERAIITDWSRLTTAKHEGKHAHVAYQLGLGNRIDYITVVPNGNILGEVSFSGHIDFSDFATIAAASSSAMFNDSPSGIGMDRFQIAASGQSFSEHLSKAEGHLNSDPPEVMERVFEIIAYLGTVDGSCYPLILEQASHEIEMEAEGQSAGIEGRYLEFSQKMPPEKQTKIIHLSPDHFKGIWLENGKIIAEVDVVKCPNCGMFHAGECPVISPDKNRPIPIRTSSIPEKIE